jgi:hypothetical protein
VLTLNLNARKRGRLARRIEIFKALHPRKDPQQEVRAIAGDAGRNMQRFCENLEIVVENLVRASLTAR